jgi:hypothetical protein
MTVTDNKPQSKDADVRYSTQEAHLRMVCPNCDRKRSGSCNHRSILNLKGNSK